MINPRAVAIIRQERADALRRKALAAAANRLEATAPAPDPAPRLRTGKRTQQAIAALQNLRRDISLGIAHADLLDRVDDELFKLKRPK